MKKLFLLLSLFAFEINAYSQAPDWLWAVTQTGGGSYAYGDGIFAGHNGDIYFDCRTGGGNVTFGTLTVGGGGTPIVHGRINSAGVFQWVKSYAYSGSFDYPFGFGIDKNDNTYSTGCISSGGGGSYVDKYNSTGTRIFSNVSWSSNSGGTGVDADDSGNIYVTGRYTGTMTITGVPTLNPIGSNDMFLAKFDSNKVCKWAVSAGGSGDDFPNDLRVDRFGNIYVFGGFPTGGSVHTFGTISVPAATNTADAFIAKYDNSGHIIWVTTATSAGSSAWSDPAALVLDSCGNVYVTGHFWNTAQFGTMSVTSAGSDDIFVAKCLSDGNWEWVKGAGSSGSDAGYGIALDNNFNVYVTGGFSGTANFSGQSVTSNGGQDVFVAKYSNSTGDLQWVKSGGGTSDETGSEVTVDKQGYAYIIGGYNGSATYGPSTITGTANGNIFIVKLDTSPPLKIQAYPAPLYCPGEATQLTFTVEGTFNAGNVFTAQLSDAGQSFLNPTNIGTVTGTTSSTITITIPAGTPPGNYLIRVISSNPSWGSFNNSCYSIANFPKFLPGTTSIGNNFTVTVSNNTTVCPGTQVPLNVTGGTTYLWTPSATLTCDTCHNPVATAESTTTYYVTVSNNQCPPLKDSVVVTVIPYPVLVAGPDTSLCSGQSALLNVSGAATYVWSPSTGLNCVSCASPIASPSGSTIYTVTGTNQGCSKTDSVMVNIIPPPTLVLQDITVCYNVATPLNATTNGALVWSPADQLNCAFCNNPIATMIAPTTYTVTASSGICTTTGTMVVGVDTPFVYGGNDTTIFKGTSAQLLAEGATTYSWLPTDGLSNSSIFDPVASPVTTTNYTVIGYDAAGCATTSQVLVTVNDPCLIPLPNAFSPNGDGINDLFAVLNPFVDKILDFEIYNRWGELVFQTSFMDHGWDGTLNGHAEPVGTYVYFVKTICEGNEVTYKGNVTLIR